jgi:hypothetical protein
MRVERYIRAYHKQTESLAFEVQLPPDCLTFLSMVDFLQVDIDPLLYGCYELDADQTDYIHRHFFVDNIADTDYFDYFLECDTTKVKTKEELYEQSKGLTTFVSIFCDDNDFSEGSVPSILLEQLQDLCYKIYQQGVQDGQL